MSYCGNIIQFYWSLIMTSKNTNTKTTASKTNPSKSAAKTPAEQVSEQIDQLKENTSTTLNEVKQVTSSALERL